MRFNSVLGVQFCLVMHVILCVIACLDDGILYSFWVVYPACSVCIFDADMMNICLRFGLFYACVIGVSGAEICCWYGAFIGAFYIVLWVCKCRF